MGHISKMGIPSPTADRRQRAELGIEGDAFSRFAGITAEELLEYESAKGVIDLEVARRVREALDVCAAPAPHGWLS